MKKSMRTCAGRRMFARRKIVDACMHARTHRLTEGVVQLCSQELRLAVERYDRRAVLYTCSRHGFLVAKSREGSRRER